MNKKIKIILQDLYAVDESLKPHESELIKIIEKLLVLQPDTKFDKKFARKLRAELLQDSKIKFNNNLFTSFINMTLTKKFAYASAGAGAMIVILTLVFWQGFNNTPSNINFTKLALEDNAFGSLAGGLENSQPQNLLQAEKAVGMGGSGLLMTDSRMIMPNPYAFNYNFIYKGDDFEQNEEKVKVLKRVTSDQTARNLANQIKGFNFGSLSLDKFSSLELEQINFTENKDFGYTISFAPRQGTMSIAQNWIKWPQPSRDCKDQACFENLRLKSEDVPSDDKLIKIANDFINNKDIDIANYGQPEVDRNWEQTFGIARDAYIPDTVTVRYPLLVDGQKIYEEGGQTIGLNVNINIRENKVAGIWNYQTQEYQSSSYEAETDAERILKFAKQGGRYKRYEKEQAEAKEVKLGTPELIYVKVWQHNSDTFGSSELLVPAYSFPIIEKPDNFYMQSVVVPLAKELLNEAEKQNNDVRILPAPEPMPMEDLMFQEKEVGENDDMIEIDTDE